MSDEYAAVKRGKLVLKGDKPKSKKRKHHKSKDSSEDSIVDEDCIKHGGWWKTQKIEDVSGSISIEFGDRCYVSALDNGLFTIGPPHDEGEGPSPEEIFTAFPAGEVKFALKSGYGKYVGVSKNGLVVGRSDAVGPMEQWEPLWQDDKMAILGATNKFISVNPEDDSVVVESASAGPQEFCTIRTNKAKEVNKDVVPKEEQGNLTEVEVNYVNVEQIEILISFMERNRQLCRINRGTEGRTLAKGLWEQVAEQMNCATPNCLTKTADGWRTFYNDYKCRVFRKVKAHKAELAASVGSLQKPDIGLSPAQARLYSLLCRANGVPLPVGRRKTLTIKQSTSHVPVPLPEPASLCPLVDTKFEMPTSPAASEITQPSDPLRSTPFKKEPTTRASRRHTSQTPSRARGGHCTFHSGQRQTLELERARSSAIRELARAIHSLAAPLQQIADHMCSSPKRRRSRSDTSEDDLSD